jgi:Proteasome/cyclosome repeat
VHLIVTFTSGRPGIVIILWRHCMQDDFDPAFALLSEHVTAADTGVRLGAIMGLGLAYAGTRREDVSLLALLHTLQISLTCIGARQHTDIVVLRQ